MSDLLDFVRERGELASLVAAGVLLWLSASRVSSLLRLRRGSVSDLYWNGAIAFLVAGRLGYLLIESRDSLRDLPVAIRVTDGIEPLAGALGVALALGWQLRREPDREAWRLSGEGWRWFAVAVVGLTVATIGYDVACPLRDACYGTTAPAPLGFTMSGLADTRIATPLVEAAALLTGLGFVVGLLHHLQTATVAAIVIGGLSALRLALSPLAVGGGDGWTLETIALAAVVVTSLVVASWAERPQRWRDAKGAPA